MPKSQALVALAAAALLVAMAAAQCTVNTPSGTVDLSQIPAAALPINQMYQGGSTPYTWVISLCQAVSQPPSGASACADGAGFISEFTTSNCETAWTTPTSAWAYDTTKNAAWAGFVNSKGWPATVYIGCGNALNLQAVGNVEVSNSLAFTFTLTSSALCGGAPNPPPNPQPPSPPNPQPNPPPNPPIGPIGPTPPRPGTPAPGSQAPGGPEEKKSVMTGGAWFVLAFSLVTVFYVSGTIAFYYIKQGKRGKELVPHAEFWTSIPGLCKDGCIFTKDKIVQLVQRIRGGGGGGGGDSTYQQV